MDSAGTDCQTMLGVLEWNPHPWCLLSFFLLCFWSLCLGGVRRHGGWVDELMSLHVAVLASTPVSRLHGYELAGEPVSCHFPGAIHPVFRGSLSLGPAICSLGRVGWLFSQPRIHLPSTGIAILYYHVWLLNVGSGNQSQDLLLPDKHFAN